MLTKTLIFFITLFLKCATPVFAEETLSIYTVNYPLQYFAQRIAGKHAKVIFPAPANQDPAFWMPDTAMIGQYQGADLILLNGANYAKWVGKVSLPRLKMINTSELFSLKYITVTGEKTHSHGREGEHSHSGIAFTTWLNFSLAVQQAESIKNALVNKRPLLQKHFESQFLALKEDLLALDGELKKATSAQPNLPFIASHPIYQYLAHRYQINLQTVLWEPDQFPTASAWQELEQQLSGHPATWMIWESTPLPESVAMLSSLGVNSLVFDPCAKRPKTGDFLQTMRQNVDNIRKAYAETYYD